jgi:3-hydroxyisobutyrate dehydrogenase
VKVGFIGLGSQGGPMAEMIDRAGFDLRIWARREAVRADYRERGVGVAETPADLAGDCELLCLCVTGDNDILELVDGAGVLGAMRRGSILLIHSTISPETCQDVAAAAATRGIAVLDAPVSGSGEAARDRRLLVLVGGESAVLERARPVLSSYGDPVVHVGVVGDGQRTKIVNNLACIANMAVANLSLRLGESVGLDRAVLRQALLNGSGRSFALDAMDRLIRPSNAGHAAALFEKDTQLAGALAPETQFTAVGSLIRTFIDELRSSEVDRGDASTA